MLGEMIDPYFAEYLRSITAARRIEIEDVRALRRILEEEVAVNRSVIESLSALDRSVQGGPEWQDFLAETIADFVVWVEGPLGKVSQETSAWLIDTLHGDGRAPAPSAVRAARLVIAEAEESDPSLTLFALSLPSGILAGSPTAHISAGSAEFVM